MPCYEVRTVSVEFKAKNEALLHKAIKELGWTEYQLGNNRLRVTNKNYDSFTIDLGIEKA